MKQENSCGSLLKLIHDRLERNANNELREGSLTLVQVSILLFLQDAPKGEATLKEIEHHLHVAQSTTVGIAGRLEQKEFVRIQNSNIDRRIRIVAITEKGKACCADAESNMNRTEERLLCGFSPEERAQVKQFLKRMGENMR